MSYIDLFNIDPDDCLIHDNATGLSAYVVNDFDAHPPDWDNPTADELAMYDAGEVYGILIADDAGHHIDSCWGFYEWFTVHNPNSYIRQEATAMLTNAVHAYRQSAPWVTI